MATKKKKEEEYFPISAWCYRCRKLTPMAQPVPRVVVKNGVSIRDGRCSVCRDPVYRIGGARQKTGEL